MTLSVVEDVYFLTRLPFQGMALPTDTQLSGDVRLIDVARGYCMRSNLIPGSIIHIEVMDALFHQCIEAMVVRVYGYLATQRITNGQLRIMERVLDGEFFSWGLMLHAKMMG
jgi:hypothetical protein